jgi:hypothetical protein
MNKYNIEGGIDFYDELYKSLDIDEDESINNDTNKCLITNEILTNNYVTMKCGHKFNYIPLYNDLLNHKKKFNNMESSNKLQTNQLRCPYCRKKQNELLPYYQECGVKKVNGVNFFVPNAKELYNNINFEKCKYQIKESNFDETKPETAINKKYKTCNFIYATPIELYNPKNPSQNITYNDENCYCYSHKKLMINQYKSEEKEKVKQLEKAAKQKLKDESKFAKELEKQKLKEEKQKMKEIAKFSKNKSLENIVIGLLQVDITQNKATTTEDKELLGCVQILKTGPNKGKQCGCKISSVNLCGRHVKYCTI